MSEVEVEQPFKRARTICGELDNPRELFPALFGLWSVYHVRGQSNEARESGARLLKLAESLDDRIPLIMAHYTGRDFSPYRETFFGARASNEDARHI